MASRCSTRWTRITMLSVNELAGFGVGGDAGGHQHWRVLLSGADVSGAYQLCSDLQMRAVSGGADQCDGGTASASNTQSGYPVTNAFDANNATLWSSGTSGTTTEWVAYQFLAPVDVQEVSYMSNTLASNRGPTEMKLQYSDDPSWTSPITVKTWSGITGWLAGVAKTFTV